MAEAEAPLGRTVAQILLDSSLPQLDHLFDYSIPDHLATEIRVGHRVRVPFRAQNRQSHGYVIGFVETSSFGGALHQITEIVGSVPQLDPDVWRLARSVADRAGGSAGDIIRLAIPQRMVRAEKKFLASLELETETETALAPASEPDSGAKSAEAVAEAVAGAVLSTIFAPEHAESELATGLNNGARFAVTASHGPTRLATGEWVGGWALQLARAAMAVYHTGRSVVIVAPDYRDVDQLKAVFEALGHHGLVRVDSRQTSAERYTGFLRAHQNVPRIILGNRSAIYAPAHLLGAIMLWDDGDPLLAEPLTPYVHARDAALVRAEQSGAGLLFAAHSHSSEVQRLIELGYVHLAGTSPRRTRVVVGAAVHNREMFAARVPDFAAKAIRTGLETGPVLVQVATPGYAPIAVCATCKDPARCKSCAGPIGFRAGKHIASCRWCGELAGAWRCAHCNGAELQQRGMGSQRTVEQFTHQFMGVRIVLSDGEHPLDRVDSRPALIVATRGAEPIAAGGYQAVILLDVERLLSYESLRAGEDCLRWWSNAAALAAPKGICVVASGGGPVVQAFATDRADQWLKHELHERQILRYPPMVRVASVTGGKTEVDRAIRTVTGLSSVDTLGPTPVEDRAAIEGLVRSIVRFDYAQGAEVAKRLRGALVADAAGSSSRVAGRLPGRARPHALRLRFDDRVVFDG